MQTAPAPRTSYLLLAFLLPLVLFSSCKKKPDDPTVGFSEEIQKIVPQKIIDDLRSRGMVIFEGTIPPTVSGSYLAAPFRLLSPYAPEDPYAKGKVITSYSYTFYGQSSGNAISYDFTNNSTDKGTGKGAFIAGNGNSFTIFSEDQGIFVNTPYKNITVISGELTPGGIKNFQYAFVIKEKTGDDNDSQLIPVNTGRIWIDGDQLAEKQGGGRLAAGLPNQAGNSVGSH